MKKSYKGDIARRLSINLSPEDEKRLDYIYAELESHFGLDTKPSISLIMLTVMKKFIESEPDFVTGLYSELLEASQTKNPRAARIALYANKPAA